ncbi:hypothetical protein K458DRAFT_319086, partial [Lentithecium fluviatile CBS 122367]
WSRFCRSLFCWSPFILVALAGVSFVLVALAVVLTFVFPVLTEQVLGYQLKGERIRHVPVQKDLRRVALPSRLALASQL